MRQYQYILDAFNNDSDMTDQSIVSDSEDYEE